MCQECRDIREELSSIVIRRMKVASSSSKTVNSAKEQRRRVLQEQLASHGCPDREAGRLDVPDNHSPTLARARECWASNDGLQAESEQKSNDLGLSGSPNERDDSDNL